MSAPKLDKSFRDDINAACGVTVLLACKYPVGGPEWRALMDAWTLLDAERAEHLAAFDDMLRAA